MDDEIMPEVFCPKLMNLPPYVNPEVTDSEISINSYQVVRLDRNRHGGGITTKESDINTIQSLSYAQFPGNSTLWQAQCTQISSKLSLE